MAANKFRYEVIVTSGFNSIANPLSVFDLQYVNDPSFVVTETLEKGQFYYIKQIKSDLNLIKDDYNYFITNFGKCYKYYVKIYKTCIDEEYQIGLAYFSDIDMEIDKDKCNMNIKLNDNSPYNCINKNRSKKINVYGAPAVANVFLGLNPQLYRTIDWWQAVLTVCTNLNCCDEYGCYYPPVSDFFNWVKDGFGATIFPDDQALTNYVNPAQRNYYVRLAAKSDIKNPTASNPATKVELTFDDIEKIMREVFNVYWVLEGLYFRWEHYSYFTRLVNYDAINATNFPFNEYKNKVKINGDEIPSSEFWNFMEANGIDFVGTPILYSEDCSNGDEKERGYELLTTDIQYIFIDPNSIDNNGIVLIDCFKVNATPQWYVYSATGAISAATVKNVRLSTANLHYDLHRHGRPLLYGSMNNVFQTFLSKVPNVEQNEIVVENCCLDLYEKYKSTVRTEIGDGVIDEAEVDYKKEIIKFKLRHDYI